uniref:WH2 domain-containing protein n=1 Tax=Acrobeloides nanus TaxID=290746 RepID=A0A914C8A9_9BILA
MEEIRIGPKRKLRTYYQSHESLAPESKFSKKSELNELIVPPTNVPQAPPPPPPRELSRDVAKLVLSNDRSDLMKEIRKGAKLKPAVPAAPPPPPASLLQNPETANVVLNGDRATLMGDIRKFGQTILKPKTPNNNPEEDSFKQQIHARRRGISSSTDDDENQENVVSNNNNDVSVLSPIDRVKQMPKLLNSNASSKNPSDDEDWK